jgi:hypothetical protein
VRAAARFERDPCRLTLGEELDQFLPVEAAVETLAVRLDPIELVG